MTNNELVAELKRENEVLYRLKESHNHKPVKTSLNTMKNRVRRRTWNQRLRRYVG